MTYNVLSGKLSLYTTTLPCSSLYNNMYNVTYKNNNNLTRLYSFQRRETVSALETCTLIVASVIWSTTGYTACSSNIQTTSLHTAAF